MLRLIFFSFSLFITTLSFGQQQAINAIKKGDAKALQSSLTEEVDISFNDNGDLVPKSTATKQLETFFTANKVASYTVSHTGKSPDNKSFFSIAKMKAGTKTYRVYLKYSIVNGIDMVKELRFNEE